MFEFIECFIRVANVLLEKLNDFFFMFCRRDFVQNLSYQVSELQVAPRSSDN